MTIAKFTNPPLIEVVFGVEFEEAEFSSVHLGLYWQTIRDRFPSQSDRPPILELEEVAYSSMPPLRRVFFLSEENKSAIQIQENFFYYNWMHTEGDKYPHFKKTFPVFLQEWNHLQEWWSMTEQTSIKPSKYQLTYLNFIAKDSNWYSAGDHEKVFTFVGGDWNGFLGTPNFHDSRLSFTLPNNQGTLVVDIDQRIEETENSDSNHVLFRLTAQSFDSDSDVVDWFRSANEYMVKAFLELTKKDAQRKWGYHED